MNIKFNTKYTCEICGDEKIYGNHTECSKEKQRIHLHDKRQKARQTLTDKDIKGILHGIDTTT